MYRYAIRANIDYDLLLDQYKDDSDKCAKITELFELLADALESNKATIRISGEDKPIDTVRTQFLKLTKDHIIFVLDALEKNTTRIKHPRNYMLTALFYAPSTMTIQYGCDWNHDRYKEQAAKDQVFPQYQPW